MRVSIFFLIFAIVGGGLLKYIEFYYSNAQKAIERPKEQPALTPTWEFKPQPGMIEEDYEWVKNQLARGWMNVSQTPDGEIFASPWMPQAMPVAISKQIVSDVVSEYTGTERPRLKDQVRPEHTFLGDPRDARKQAPRIPRTSVRKITPSPEAMHKARMDAMNRSGVRVNEQWLEERDKHYKYKKKLGEITERESQAHAVIQHLRKQHEELKKYNDKLKNEIAELEDSVLPY